MPLDAARVAIRIATRVATVYTNAPKRPRGAILANLCTLLRPHGRSQQRNSVHKRPNPARRGPILPFVYTIAIPRPPTTQAHGATVYTNAPKRRREAILANLCTLLRRRPGGDAHAALAVTQPPTHTNSRSLPYDVVPLAVEVLPGDVEGARLLVGDPDPGLVRAGVDLAHDPEAPRGRRRGDGAGDHLKRPRRPAAPVAGDLGEDAVLDLVPL